MQTSDDSTREVVNTQASKHLSTQIDAAPKYVAEVFGRLAAEHTEASDDSSAVRGYN
ncbi:hypothetical protein LA345_41460 (plasmid) [Burkholderia vietnamiensis]|nr:hypothetical protein [Burkholderia vietnamiensis]